MRFGFAVTIAMTAALAAGSAGAAPKRPAPSVNPGNDLLAKMAPAERAAALAKVVGHWCIGTETFLMGVAGAESGNAAGYAYWSVRCADGGTWVVQIDPAGNFVTIECAVLQANGGKECFKKF